MGDLSAVFRPRAIAVVGASDDPIKIGGRPLAFLLRHGYRGRVYPVNPSRTTVQGLPAFPSVAAIPDEVDLAVVVVPAERVLEALEAAAARGIRAAITGAAAAPDAADQVGYPVAVKICSARLPHKSDVGGVVLGLPDRVAVADACRRIEAEVRARAPGIPVEGFVIQRQARGALELALGVKTDPVFGPVVLVGSGGVLIEVLRDFRLLLPPIDAAVAQEALRALRIGPLWDGVRGGAPLDLPAAIALLQQLGEAARGLSPVVREIDLNPVLVGRRGEGVTVLDALVKL